MKRKLILTIIACGASLALCPGLQAQDASPAASAAAGDAATGGHGGRHGGGGAGGGGGDMLARLTTALTLTADEQAKIKPIIDASRTSMQSIHSDTTLAPADKKAKMKDARDSETSQINAVLTPDQQTKFAALQANMHAGGGRHGGDGHGGGATEVAPSAAPSASQ